MITDKEYQRISALLGEDIKLLPIDAVLPMILRAGYDIDFHLSPITEITDGPALKQRKVGKLRWHICEPRKLRNSVVEFPKMTKINDASPNVLEFIKPCVGMIEATNSEKNLLWEKYHESVEWKSGSAGYIVNIATLLDRPISLSLWVDTINGKPILFYHGVSSLVDHDLIMEWLEKNMPEEVFINRTDASNFHIILHNKG